MSICLRGRIPILRGVSLELSRRLIALWASSARRAGCCRGRMNKWCITGRILICIGPRPVTREPPSKIALSMLDERNSTTLFRRKKKISGWGWHRKVTTVQRAGCQKREPAAKDGRMWFHIFARLVTRAMDNTRALSPGVSTRTQVPFLLSQHPSLEVRVQPACPPPTLQVVRVWPPCMTHLGAAVPLVNTASLA